MQIAVHLPVGGTSMHVPVASLPCCNQALGRERKEMQRHVTFEDPTKNDNVWGYTFQSLYYTAMQAMAECLTLGFLMQANDAYAWRLVQSIMVPDLEEMRREDGFSSWRRSLGTLSLTSSHKRGKVDDF